MCSSDLAEFIGSFRIILDQEPVSPPAFVWPVVFYLFFMAALKDFPLLFLLRRALRRTLDGTLYPDRLHLVTPDGEDPRLGVEPPGVVDTS